MKRVAILTGGPAPVADEMALILNSGNRFRVGRVPIEIASADIDTLINALAHEGVDLVIIENYPREIPSGFPIPIFSIIEGEDALSAIRRLSEEYSDRPESPQSDIPGFSNPPAPEYPEMPPVESQQMPDGFSERVNVDNNNPNFERPMPRTYLLWAILSTIFCCFIPGVIAIIFSSLVSSRYYNGNYDGARKASRMAEIWIIASIVLGVVSYSLYIPSMMLGF